MSLIFVQKKVFLGPHLRDWRYSVSRFAYILLIKVIPQKGTARRAKKGKPKNCKNKLIRCAGLMAF